MAMLVAVTCLARRRRMHCRGRSDAAAAATSAMMELEQLQSAPHDQRHHHHRWPAEPGLQGLSSGSPLDRRRRRASSTGQGRGRLPHGGAGPAPDSGRRLQTAGTERAPEPEEAPAAVAVSEEAPVAAAGDDAGAGADDTASAPSSDASSSSPVLCAVCLEEVRRGRGGEAAEATTTLPCSHSYHPDCVLPWLAAHGDCPCGRAAVLSPDNFRH